MEAPSYFQLVVRQFVNFAEETGVEPAQRLWDVDPLSKRGRYQFRLTPPNSIRESSWDRTSTSRPHGGRSTFGFRGRFAWCPCFIRELLSRSSVATQHSL